MVAAAERERTPPSSARTWLAVDGDDLAAGLEVVRFGSTDLRGLLAHREIDGEAVAFQYIGSDPERDLRRRRIRDRGRDDAERLTRPTTRRLVAGQWL
ncbi:MAG: hypothetical protein U1F20_03320 [Lysobacterales bacterium]